MHILFYSKVKIISVFEVVFLVFSHRIKPYLKVKLVIPIVEIFNPNFYILSISNPLLIFPSKSTNSF